MCSSCRGIVTETRKCFWGHNNALKLHMTMLSPHPLPPTIPASEMSCFLAQAPGLISQALKRAPCSLWSLLFMAHCNCWKWRLHPAWLSTRKKCSEMLGSGFGFLALWSANPRAKRTGLDSIPCSPITWMAAEPARYNKSHVLFGVGRWELPLLHFTRITVPGKKKKIPFPQISWPFPARPDFARGLPNS